MPRRDTQIFSLSMMDVISGAMGAFLIIMVVLMRYYKEDEEITKQREEVQKQLEEIQRQIDEAIKQLQNTTDIDVAELLRRLKAMQEQLVLARQQVNKLSNDLQAARSRVNQLERETQELQAENNRIAKERDTYKWRLEFRRPFLVTARWHASRSVDVGLFVESSKETVDGRRILFDPDGENLGCFTGDLIVTGYGENNSEIWVVRDTRPGATFKIYTILNGKVGELVPTNLQVYANGEDLWHSFETYQLDASNRWELVGILTTDDEGKTTARSPTDAERSEDRRAVELRVQENRMKQTTQPSDNQNDNGGGE